MLDKKVSNIHSLWALVLAVFWMLYMGKEWKISKIQPFHAGPYVTLALSISQGRADIFLKNPPYADIFKPKS